MGKRRRENDTEEAPSSKRGSQADEEDVDFQQTQGESQEDDDEPMEEENFEDIQDDEDDVIEPGKNGTYLFKNLIQSKFQLKILLLINVPLFITIYRRF